MIFWEKFMKTSTVFLRTPYNYDTMEASDASGLACEDESLAQQHMKDECDINTILKRFAVTGQLPENVRAPQYGDFTGIGDYQSALLAVKAAEASFMQLPAEVRYRFGNDPQALLEFVANADNRAEAEKLGLVVPGTTQTNPAPEQGGGVDQSST